MAGLDSGSGTAGSSFTKYNYPGIYQDQDFHTCRHGIDNWNSASDIQTCELSGLAEYVRNLPISVDALTEFVLCTSLATETEYVRSRLAQYGNDLLSLGVDGLRLDAAKRRFYGT